MGRVGQVEGLMDVAPAVGQANGEVQRQGVLHAVVINDASVGVLVAVGILHIGRRRETQLGRHPQAARDPIVALGTLKIAGPAQAAEGVGGGVVVGVAEIFGAVGVASL